MHRSRLAGFIIDCLGEDLDGASDFWSQALGLPRRRNKATEDAGYIKLEMPSGEMDIEVQRVDHPSRVHLDIEADDIPAEVARAAGEAGREEDRRDQGLGGDGRADRAPLLRGQGAEQRLRKKCQ